MGNGAGVNVFACVVTTEVNGDVGAKALHAAITTANKRKLNFDMLYDFLVVELATEGRE